LLILFAAVNLFRFGPNLLTRWTGRGVSIPGLTAVIDYFRTYSHGVLVLDFFATVFLVCTARLGFRLYREELRPVSSEGVRRVLVVGAGDAAESILRQIYRMPEERYRVVGLVDDDPTKQGIFIHGAPVLGTTEGLRGICEERKVQEIIIAMPSATQKELRRVIEVCKDAGLKFRVVSGIRDLTYGWYDD
jgi:FlaA1/EpsC-like NDP-sugar epimerase